MGSARAAGVEPETRCDACGRLTKTIGGLCPHCGAVKDARRVPVSSAAPRLDPWGAGWLSRRAVVFGSTSVLIVIAAILFAPEILFGLVLLVVIYGLFSGLLDL